MAEKNKDVTVLVVSFVLSLFSLTLIGSSSSLPNNGQLVPGMYVLGDSLVDVGNNNHLISSFIKANFPHNGIDFPAKKSTGRFCNGKNAVDLLSEKVGLPYSLPYLSMQSNLSKSNEILLKGVNFASGGSGIMDETNKRLVIPFTKQVDNFIAVNKDVTEKLGSSGAYNHFSKSLFLIVTGSNDIFGYFRSDYLRNKSSAAQYMDLMAKTLEGQFKRLYSFGARKFVIVGVGVIGCIPSIRIKLEGEQCDDNVNRCALMYNEALKSMLRNLKLELNGINYSYFDGYGAMLNVIQNQAAYGFSEVKGACCGLGKLKAGGPCLPFSTYCSNRSDHLFWDQSHPTEATHKIFVNYMFDGPSQYSSPINVKKLIVV